MVNVGKYTSPMDGMGFGMSRVGSFKDVLSWFDIPFVNYGASESQNLKTAFVACLLTRSLDRISRCFLTLFLTRTWCFMI